MPAFPVSASALELSYRGWRRRIFATTWLTYASFYLCRNNLAAVIPLVTDAHGDHALLTNTEAGYFGSAMTWSYAIGQLVNGQIGQRFGARACITVGMLVSVLANVAVGAGLGLGAPLSLLVALWGVNGYFQSLGWPSSVKTMGEWFTFEERGRIMGWWTTCYQFGGVLCAAVTGVLLHYFPEDGWQLAFFVPAGLLAASMVHFAIRVRNTPADVDLPPVEVYRALYHGEEPLDDTARAMLSSTPPRWNEPARLMDTVRLVLGNPVLWTLALCYASMNVVRNGFMYWLPKMLVTVRGDAPDMGTFKSVVVPLAGSLGALFAGWASDRFFDSRRAPIATLMLGGLALSTALFVMTPSATHAFDLGVLSLIGFFTYGPDSILSATAPMDFGGRKAASAAAGFVDGLGYVAAGFGLLGLGWVADHHGWERAFSMLIVAALVAMALSATLWNQKPVSVED